MSWRYDKVGGRPSIHTQIAESVLGRKLNKGECVHHIDNNGRNNRHDNLVICPNESYHKLLHIRQQALKESGDANNKKCRICKCWDSEINLRKYARTDALTPRYYHTACHKKSVAEYRAKSKENQK